MDDRLVQRVETVHGRSPHETRRELAEACIEVVGGGTGLFMRQQPDDEGIIRYADFSIAGPLDFMHGFAGRPVYEGSAHDPTEHTMRRRRGRWSLHSPARRHTNRFSTLRQDVDPDQLHDLPVMRDVYTPAGIVDQARMFVVANDRVIGWFGVWTTGREGTIEPDVLAELNRAADGIASALVAVDVVDRWDADGSVAIARANGTLEATTPDVAAWLDDDRRTAIARRVRRLDRKDAPPVFAVGRALVRVTRLDGPDGVRYLLTFTARQPRLAATAALTPRQREVADLAALGMTVDEVADALRISVNTVKTHLRHVYDALHVANRVELAEALRGR